MPEAFAFTSHLQPAGVEAAHGDLFNVLSFNLRNDANCFGRKNSWDVRKYLATELIRSSGASIVGVQELSPSMKRDVESLLSEYSSFGLGRSAGSQGRTNEHSDVIINNGDASVVTFETFWISKNPDAASRALGTFFPRICTVAEVFLKKYQRRVRVFNTHLDHISPFARNLGARMILSAIDRYNSTDPLPCIVMGDFNARQNSFAIKMLRHNMLGYSFNLVDIYSRIDCICNTHHGFKGSVKARHSPIDYIFVSQELEIVDAKIYTQPCDGLYPSDHFPVSATLRFRAI